MNSSHTQLGFQFQALVQPRLSFGSLVFPSEPLGSFSPRLYKYSFKRCVSIRSSADVAEQKPKRQLAVKRAYPFHEIEPKWQRFWEEDGTFRTPDEVDMSKPKYYVLDMFPYPSGAGLHVGHPLGYTATDILARLKRMQGYNVLHPMGWDAFGLPAEQYAIETGTHPKITTLKNINLFRSQVIEWAEKTGIGKKKVNYTLRDWLFAQQCYSGEPIPVIFSDDSDEGVPLHETELPLTLPELDDFSPTGTGEPTIEKAVSWVQYITYKRWEFCFCWL